MKSHRQPNRTPVLTAEPVALEFIRLASATAILFGLLKAAHVLPV